VKVSQRRMRVVGQFGQKGVKEYRRGEHDAEVNTQRVEWMLRGQGSGAGTPVLQLQPLFQASPYLDHEESTTVVVVVAATRAIVAVSSDLLKSDTSTLSPIKVTQRCTCK
jgi:hypothetical protein